MSTAKFIFRKSRRLPDFFKFWNSSQAFFKDFDYSVQNSCFLEHCNYANNRKILKIMRNIFNQFWTNVPFCEPLKVKGNTGSEWFNNRIMIRCSLCLSFFEIFNTVFLYCVLEFLLLIAEIRICNYSVKL